MRIPLNNPPKPSNVFGVPDSNAAFKRHAGIDWPVSTGTPVYAAAPGLALVTRNDQYHGNKVDISYNGYLLRCMHLSQIKVSDGQQVAEGDLIGLSGNTGLSTGPHLHFDVRNQWQPTSFAAFVEPLAFIKQGGIDVIPDLSHLDDMFQRFMGRNSNTDEQKVWIGKYSYTQLIDVLKGQKAYKDEVRRSEVGYVAERDDWVGQIKSVQKPSGLTDTGPQVIKEVQAVLDAHKA